MPLVGRGDMCRWDWSGMILPESRSDRSGEHDCIRDNQVVGDAAVGIFYGEAQVMIDGVLRECLDSPIRRVDECGLLEQWVGFLDCF